MTKKSKKAKLDADGNITLTKAETRRRESRIEFLAGELANKTPAQARKYIDRKVTDLQSAKRVMKIMAVAIVALAKEIED